jgi:Spy/CpxP family protein refolding chaperone
MKAKVLMTALLMGYSVFTMAQPSEKEQQHCNQMGPDKEMLGKGGPQGPESDLNLTDEQKDAFKKSHLAMQKELQPLQNQLAEAKVHQRTLETSEKIDMDAVNKNIEKIGALKVQIEKIETKYRLDMRAQLTDEQRIMFDAHGPKMMDGPRMMEGSKMMDGPQGGMRDNKPYHGGMDK